MRLPATVLLLVAVAGCAQTPAQPGSSLPMSVIVNDPAARAAGQGPAIGSDRAATQAPRLIPLPEAPLHDELVGQIRFDTVFDHIRGGYGLADVDHPWVRTEYDWYARHPEYLARVLERGSRYLHYITVEVDRRGMPLELALLPVVESAFNPFAYSRSRAAGLWQFIAPTGLHFGLKQNWWQDQRRDVIESTRAALDYLEYLHGVFEGDWLLAVAAYNHGSLNVRRAMAANSAAGRPTDFFSLKLPAETRAYVPKLLALSRLVRNPELVGLELPEVADAPYFRVVDLQGPIDLRLAAELAGIETEELHALNPAFHRWATDPDGPHRLLLPIPVADRFEAQLAAVEPAARLRLAAHRVTKGEDFTGIARRHGLSATALSQLNGARAFDIRVGDELWVPAAQAGPLREGLAAQVGDPPKRGKAGERKVHVVRSGDSLWSVARRHAMTTQQLASLNGISSKASLRPGQKLVVRAGERAASARDGAADADAATRMIRYTVRLGDTLYSIARRFEVTVKQLQAWNRLAHDGLRPGQRLTVHVDGRKDFGG